MKRSYTSNNWPIKAENAKIGKGIFKNGATILSNQLGEIGNIRANNKNGNKRFELSSICKKKRTGKLRMPLLHWRKKRPSTLAFVSTCSQKKGRKIFDLYFCIFFLYQSFFFPFPTISSTIIKLKSKQRQRQSNISKVSEAWINNLLLKIC